MQKPVVRPRVGTQWGQGMQTPEVTQVLQAPATVPLHPLGPTSQPLSPEGWARVEKAQGRLQSCLPPSSCFSPPPARPGAPWFPWHGGLGTSRQARGSAHPLAAGFHQACIHTGENIRTEEGMGLRSVSSSLKAEITSHGEGRPARPAHYDGPCEAQGKGIRRLLQMEQIQRGRAVGLVKSLKGEKIGVHLPRCPGWSLCPARWEPSLSDEARGSGPPRLCDLKAYA